MHAYQPGTSSDHPRIRSVELLNAHLPPASTMVVIPTYNERENIGLMLQAIRDMGSRVDVLVVDDGSPDGTADCVAEMAAEYPFRIWLMRRQGKFGLGVAYLDAHHWLMANIPETSSVIQMDADFSHDPALIPTMVERAQEHGIATGSRYVPGGSTPDWERGRLLVSKYANAYLRFVLQLFFPSYTVQDNTSGFIAWRRDVLESVLRLPLYGDGYAFLTSVKVAAHHVGFLPHEVPIVLHDRRRGISKLNKHIMLEAFFMPWRLGWAFRKKTQTGSATMHDNSLEMWDRYYASEDETGPFARFVHWGREVYFGDEFARRVIECGGPATSYLELGVGTGQTLARLQRRTGARCAGIEITPRAYEIGKAYATNCEMYLGDGKHMPFADGSYDVVYSLGLLEHFEPDEQVELLREQTRVARNTVLVEVPTRSLHMRAILWFNRRVLKKRGVWADEELFSADHFATKYPGLPFRYHFDWKSGGLTCWFTLNAADLRAYFAPKS